MKLTVSEAITFLNELQDEELRRARNTLNVDHAVRSTRRAEALTQAIDALVEKLPVADIPRTTAYQRPEPCAQCGAPFGHAPGCPVRAAREKA